MIMFRYLSIDYLSMIPPKEFRECQLSTAARALTLGVQA